jgi:hypothetical protein
MMKKIVLIVLMCLPLLLGQTIVRQETVSVAWDAVTPMGGDTISYELFVAPLGDYASAQSVGTTILLDDDITVPSEGDWVVGVRTIRTITANGEILYSSINWSDVDGLATPNPFFIRWYVAPVAPENLRFQ